MPTGQPRISARTGDVVDLNVNFLRNGVLEDPYAIRQIKIYRAQVLPHNLVATIPVVDPSDADYPSPVTQETIEAETGACGTEPDETATVVAGKYHLYWTVPLDLASPDIYYDVWEYFPTNPCGELGTGDVTGCDLDSGDYDAFLVKCCHRFWVFPDAWFCDDGLQTVRFGFEPLDVRFNWPEVRPLEIGLMPLPLYDYNYNLVNPLIPFLQSTISIETQYGQLLVDDAAMTIGIRSGSFRSNPYVLKYTLDTGSLLKGTYKYRVKLTLPDGTTRVSGSYHLTIF